MDGELEGSGRGLLEVISRHLAGGTDFLSVCCSPLSDGHHRRCDNRTPFCLVANRRSAFWLSVPKMCHSFVIKNELLYFNSKNYNNISLLINFVVSFL
jgi:hypothetical protein